MPRPLRLEYKNAYYHVMNQGRARQRIFHGDEYYEAFLATLKEADERFGVEVLCYCLMPNHYHLLIKTPEANLGRAMRHINGLYTQRHNRLKKTDGSLFRGRYKAVSVESDSYQLQLSRYIHSNALDIKKLQSLGDYPWSSYPYYTGPVKAPNWLYVDDVFRQLGCKTKCKAKYREYVEQGVDEELSRFYAKGNIRPYLGSEAFRDWVYRQREIDQKDVSNQVVRDFHPSTDEVVHKVASAFRVDDTVITTSRRGRVASNVPRWVAVKTR